MILYGYGKTFFPDSFKKKKGAVQMDKKQILLKRGFGAHDIATGFAEYKGNWNTCQLVSEASWVMASSLCSVANFCSNICSRCKAS